MILSARVLLSIGNARNPPIILVKDDRKASLGKAYNSLADHLELSHEKRTFQKNEMKCRDLYRDVMPLWC